MRRVHRLRAGVGCTTLRSRGRNTARQFRARAHRWLLVSRPLASPLYSLKSLRMRILCSVALALVLAGCASTITVRTDPDAALGQQELSLQNLNRRLHEHEATIHLSARAPISDSLRHVGKQIHVQPDSIHWVNVSSGKPYSLALQHLEAVELRNQNSTEGFFGAVAAGVVGALVSSGLYFAGRNGEIGGGSFTTMSRGIGLGLTVGVVTFGGTLVLGGNRLGRTRVVVRP